MAHSSASAARNLSLTEELEKLEQSITLTLQEIDHNFSRAHRIVTTSILPIVEQYAEHSKGVWEGSKFWKQFFEASANVSLSGYEDLTADQDDTSMSHPQDDYDELTGQVGESEYGETETQFSHDEVDEDMETPHVSRALGDPTLQPKIAEYPSPYEALKRELKGKGTDDDTTSVLEPVTPSAPYRIPDMSMSSTTSTPIATRADTSYLASATKKNTDLLLHRVLDKNYRVQATPHSTQKLHLPELTSRMAAWEDDDTMSLSSSPIAAPQLRADLFNSPKPASRAQLSNRMAAPRTPGVSVQTPARQRTREVPESTTQTAAGAGRDEITWESDSDDDADGLYKGLGMSPPKTIQFAFPQSRVLQTPAHEASKRIVDDLLRTAGGAEEEDIDLEIDIDSPAIIKSRDDLLDDDF